MKNYTQVYSLQYLLQKILAEAEFLKQMADQGVINNATDMMPTDSLTYAMAMVAAGPVYFTVICRSNSPYKFALQIATGIEQALLSKYETGKRVPPTETLILLSDFYGVSIDYILKRTDKPEINR